MLLLFRAAGFVAIAKEQKAQRPVHKQQQQQHMLHGGSCQQPKQQMQQAAKPVLQALKGFLTEAAAIRGEQAKLKGELMQQRLFRVCREIVARDEYLSADLHISVRKSEFEERSKAADSTQQQQQMRKCTSLPGLVGERKSIGKLLLQENHQWLDQLERDFLAEPLGEGLQEVGDVINSQNSSLHGLAGTEGAEQGSQWVDEFVQGVCSTAAGEVAGTDRSLQQQQPQWEMHWPLEEQHGNGDLHGFDGLLCSSTMLHEVRELCLEVMLVCMARRLEVDIMDLMAVIKGKIEEGEEWDRTAW
jgi:hypothetical protein